MKCFVIFVLTGPVVVATGPHTNTTPAVESTTSGLGAAWFRAFGIIDNSFINTIR
jgi:hypothetical protein